MEKILTFLEIKDVRELEAFHQTLENVTDDDYFIINNVLDKWDDPQAIANLLLFPLLIPEKRKWQVFDKALESYDVPYLILAGVSGLRKILVEQIPVKFKRQYVFKLLRFCKTNTYLLSTMSFCTFQNFLDEENYRDVLRLYPLANQNMNDNIINAIVLLFHNLTLSEYKKKLKKGGITWMKRKNFVKRLLLFQKKALKKEDMIVMPPPIPNLVDIK